MSGVNVVHLIGNLGRDPETRETQGGSTVCNFSIATSETFTKDGEKQERVEWHRICAFGKTAEICGKYLVKGKQVYIHGSLQTRSWEKDGQKRSSTEVVCRNMVMLGGKGERSSGEYERPSGDAPGGGGDDNIPF